MAAPPTADQRIRAGLDFLYQADRRIVKSAAQLAILLDAANLPTVGELLKWFNFHVQERHYSGRMTQEQADQLYSHQHETLEKFANAVANLLLCLNGTVTAALTTLGNGL